MKKLKVMIEVFSKFIKGTSPNIDWNQFIMVRVARWLGFVIIDIAPLVW